MLVKRSVHLALRGTTGCMLFPCLHHSMDFQYLADRVAALKTWPFATYPRIWAGIVLAVETCGSLAIVLGDDILCKLGALVLIPKMVVAVYGHAAVDTFDDGFNNKDHPYYKNAILPYGSQNWALGSSWQCGFFGAAWYLVGYCALVAWPWKPTSSNGRFSCVIDWARVASFLK